MPSPLNGRSFQLLVVVACLLCLSCGSQSEEPSRRPVSYLVETVAPCSPSMDTGTNPCLDGKPDEVPYVEAVGTDSSYPLWPHTNELPTFTDMLVGRSFDSSAWIPHIVVRGTVQSGTTRCETYPVEPPNFRANPENDSLYIYLYHHHCFIDLKVSEYIVGEGSADLTIGIHRNVVWLPGQELAEVGDQWISRPPSKDPRSRTADAFDGRETGPVPPPPVHRHG